MATELRLARGMPEELGIPSAAILAFVDQVERDIHELHSFMLVRHGQVAAEGWWSPYAPERPHMLFSLSKSFTSTAIGMTVGEGLLTIDDPVLSFFPAETPETVSKNLAAMRVRHLLSMSTGHAKDATRRTTSQKDGDWIRGFLAAPVRYKPGTHFVYNSAATFMLSAILQKLTGKTLLAYLTPRLFEPLGVEKPTWEENPQGINVGGWGLNLRTEDIARFGQLYLQKGTWQCRQLVPEAWVDAATAKQISNGDDPESDWAQGYGFQFWRCRHNAYRGDGAFGQYCLVMPEQDAVLAITSGVSDMQAVLNVVWECLLPAMKKAPLPPNPGGQAALRDRLASLRLPPPEGQAQSPLAEQVSQQTYSLNKNWIDLQSLAYQFGPEDATVRVGAAQGKYAIECGYGAWKEGTVPMLDRGPQPALSSGVWSAPDTFAVTTRFYLTPFYQVLTSHFDGKRVTASVDVNVSFGPKKLPTLQGRVRR